MFEIINSQDVSLEENFGTEFNYRDCDHNFVMSSKVLRDIGTHDCGYKFVKSPNTSNMGCSIFALDDNIENLHNLHDDENEHDPLFDSAQRTFRHMHLNSLIDRNVNRVITDSDGTSHLDATGNIKNIIAWAEDFAGEDEDQKQAFILITAALVLEVCKLADKNENFEQY